MGRRIVIAAGSFLWRNPVYCNGGFGDQGDGSGESKVLILLVHKKHDRMTTLNTASGCILHQC